MTSQAMSMKDEPAITLPTLRVTAVTLAASAVAGLGWAGVAILLGYDAAVVQGGVLGAGLTAAVATVVFLLTMPWMPKPASTSMLLWVASDMGAIVVTLGVGYLLYSATFPAPGSGPAILLGIALAYFCVLLAKVAVAASHMKTLGLM